MFGLGIWEILVILVIALVIMGPDRLPTMAKALGRGMREFRKATREIQASLEVEEVRRTVRRTVDVARSPRRAIRREVSKHLLGDEEDEKNIEDKDGEKITGEDESEQQEIGAQENEPADGEKKVQSKADSDELEVDDVDLPTALPENETPEKALKAYEELTKPSADEAD